MLRERPLALSQFIVIIVVVVVLLLAWDLWQRINDTMLQVRALEQAGRDLQALEYANGELRELKQYVLSDAFVEKKARTGNHFARENEVLVVPIARPPAKATPVPVVAQPPPPRPIWQDVLDALFGSTP
jgi:hypothetical protein